MIPYMFNSFFFPPFFPSPVEGALGHWEIHPCLVDSLYILHPSPQLWSFQMCHVTWAMQKPNHFHRSSYILYPFPPPVAYVAWATGRSLQPMLCRIQTPCLHYSIIIIIIIKLAVDLMEGTWVGCVTGWVFYLGEKKKKIHPCHSFFFFFCFSLSRTLVT